MNKFKDGLSGLFSKGKSLGALATALLIVVVIIFNVIIFNLTRAFGLYIYKPEMTDLRISGNTDYLFSGISEGKTVTIAFCMEEEDLKNHATGSYVWQTVRQLDERYDFIKVKYVNMLNHRDENGELFPFSKFITQDEKGEDIPINSSSVIFYEGEGENFRVITDRYTSAGFVDFFTLDSQGSVRAYIGEEVVASMVAWVLHDEHPTAYITEKHGETVDVSFGNMLTCAGYEIKIINLREVGKEIPSDAALVVISNPTSDFYRIKGDSSGRSEIEKLESYLDRGGSVYVTLDPLSKNLPVLEGFLAERGIKIAGTTDDSGRFIRALVSDSDNGITTDGYSFVCDYASSPASSRINAILSTYTDTRVLISGVAALELDTSLGAQPLLVSSSSSSLVADGEKIDNDGEYVIAALSERRNDDGTYGRVVLVPSIYMTASDALVSEGYANGDYLYSLFYAFFDSTAAPIGMRAVTYGAPTLEGFTMKRAHTFTAIVIAIPVVIMAIGAVVIIKRKNR